MDDEKRQLLNYLNSLLKQEESLRRKYEIGDNYRALPNQLKTMLAYAQEHLGHEQENVEQENKQNAILAPHQQLVYVHLFNASGKTMSRWANILSPRNLMEYAVNRPIYADESQVKAYIRSRPQVDEHAYIIVKIDKTAVLSDQARDPQGQPLLKLKEKTLSVENLVLFVHNSHRYRLVDGQLILADDD